MSNEARTETKAGWISPAMTVDLVGASMRIRWIPPGTFMMGSPDGEFDRTRIEGPQHKVTLTKGFWMAETPVTQAQWRAVLGDNPSITKGDSFPAANVDWGDCQYFCSMLTQQLNDHLKFGLPTEAQWEYACRAGTTTPYNDGRPCESTVDTHSSMEALGWYYGNSDGRHQPVAQKSPNAWGLHDMHGGVWEWCEDWWQGDYNGAGNIDPAGPPDGRGRVMRGGSAWNFAIYCRSAYRSRWSHDHRYFDLGFRPIAM